MDPEKPRRSISLLIIFFLLGYVVKAQELKLGQLIGHKGEISQLAFTPDGKYLFSSSKSDSKIFMWDVEMGKVITSSPQMPVNNMVVSPTGEYVTTTDYLGYLWNVKANTAREVSDGVDVEYFTGEGGSYKDQFYYLTRDIGLADAIDDPSLRENYTICTEELTMWFTSVPARKQVLILDACSSGNFISAFGQTRDVSSDQIRALDRMKDRTGMYVLAGSASDKVSYESSQCGQGVLTYSLLSGIKGRALRNNEFVAVSTLFQFALDEVPVIAANIGGIQRPTHFYPSNATSFDTGIVNDQVEIPLEEVKPVFELSDFEEVQSWDMRSVLIVGSSGTDH